MGKRDEARRRDRDSVLALLGLLEAVEKGEVQIPEALEVALSSQGRLAKFADAQRGIVGMSLNHLKATAAQIEGGFERLDQARLAALETIRRANVPGDDADRPPATDETSRVNAENARLKEELRLIRQDLALLQRAYDERCRQARRYAQKASPAVQAQCQRDQQALDQSLSLCRRLEKNHNVIELSS